MWKSYNFLFLLTFKCFRHRTSKVNSLNKKFSVTALCIPRQSETNFLSGFVFPEQEWRKNPSTSCCCNICKIISKHNNLHPQPDHFLKHNQTGAPSTAPVCVAVKPDLQQKSSGVHLQSAAARRGRFVRLITPGGNEFPAPSCLLLSHLHLSLPTKHFARLN